MPITRDEAWLKNILSKMQRMGTRIFGCIQDNVGRLLLVVPEWVPKDSNLTVTLLIRQIGTSIDRGLPRHARFQVRAAPHQSTSVPFPRAVAELLLITPPSYPLRWMAAPRTGTSQSSCSPRCS